jgi:glycerophosphoryl diester phosphodiesterase
MLTPVDQRRLRQHPTYFDSIGLSLEEPLVAALHRAGLDRPRSAVFIQSFEVGNLEQLNRLTPVPLVQLIDATDKPFAFVVSATPAPTPTWSGPRAWRRSPPTPKASA